MNHANLRGSQCHPPHPPKKYPQNLRVFTLENFLSQQTFGSDTFFTRKANKPKLDLPDRPIFGRMVAFFSLQSRTNGIFQSPFLSHHFSQHFSQVVKGYWGNNFGSHLDFFTGGRNEFIVKSSLPIDQWYLSLQWKTISRWFQTFLEFSPLFGEMIQFH